MNFSNNATKNLILKDIDLEFSLHPKAILTDYYKLFFQGAMGPGHAIDSIPKACKAFTAEIKTAKYTDSCLFQEINYLTKFVRVSLKTVDMGIITAEKLFEVFIKSTNMNRIISYSIWHKIWEEIQQTVINHKHIKPSLSNKDFFDNADLIEKKFNKPISHSKQFKNNYFPHYRLVLQSELIKIIPDYREKYVLPSLRKDL